MTTATPASVWTDARVEHLRQLWNGRLHSCTEIAAALGPCVTRNAVIGKVTRLGLESHGFNSGFHNTPKPKRKRAECTIRKNGTGYVPLKPGDELDGPDLKSLEDVEAQPKPATFLGIALLKLKDTHCRYPRDVDGVTLSCGQPKIEGSSYCAACHRRCHSGFHVRRAA